MLNILDQKTLIPISTIIIVTIAMFYITQVYSKVEYHDVAIAKTEVLIKDNEGAIQGMERSINKNLIEILQRLVRIETALEKK
jgi:hypothetical protein